MAEIRANGAQAAPAVLDVTDPASIVAVVDAAEAAFGTVTILVNNAGIPDAQRAHRMSFELIDQVIDTNLRGPYLLATEVAPSVGGTDDGPGCLAQLRLNPCSPSASSRMRNAFGPMP